MKKMPCPFTGKNVSIIVLREAREMGKEKYHVISLLCGLYRWIHINFFTKERELQRLRNLWLPNKKGEGRDK